MIEDSHPRLKVFTPSQVEKCREQLGPPDPAPWPEIRGCLTALCPARSGSTLLCRQLETLFQVGRMGETLNTPKLKKRSAQQIVAVRKEPWFSFKSAVRGLICAELTGFYDAYLDKTVFVRLVRRDIVAQAVSHAKANQTGQWHADRKPPGNPTYNAETIETALKSLVIGVEQMRHYVEITGRPHTMLVYEDMVSQGIGAVKAIGDVLQLPGRRLADDVGELRRPIEKMGDAVNDEWKERFLKEMSASVGAIIDDYVASVDGRTSASWAAPEGPRPGTLKRALRDDGHLDGVLAKFPEETASLARASIDTLRSSFPTATCHVTENEKDGRNKLTVRLGAERGISSPIFTVIVDPDKVKIYFEGDGPLDDADRVLRGAKGKKYLWVTSVSSLERSDVSQLFEQAVRQSRTPLPLSGRGGLIIGSKSLERRPRKGATAVDQESD